MTKTFCDACGKELKHHQSVFGFSYKVHIDDMANGNIGGYVDANLNQISGRDENCEVCISCYNKIMVPAFRILKDIQKENGMEIS